jgi:hypothetical protein
MDDRFRTIQTASNDCQIESQLIQLIPRPSGYRRCPVKTGCSSVTRKRRVHALLVIPILSRLSWSVLVAIAMALWATVAG